MSQHKDDDNGDDDDDDMTSHKQQNNTKQIHKQIQITNDIQKLDVNSDHKQLFVTGGGAFNTYLIEQLQDKLESMDIEVVIPDTETIAFKEAILMALMGYLRTMNIPNTIPSVTGAKSSTVGGSLYVPSK